MLRFTLVGLLIVMFLGAAHAATVEVNSIGDAERSATAASGLCDTGDTLTHPNTGALVPECTLRAAIETINDQDSGSLSTITFASWIEINAPNPGSSRWNPQTMLPPIEAPTHLDGTSHPLWNESDGLPRVVISGFEAPASAIGLLVQGNGSHSIIEGVSVVSFGNVGVEITTSGVTLRQSHIGVDVWGEFDVPNAVGVVVSGNGNQIGHGADPAIGTIWPNVISGNTFTGLLVSGDDNLIAGNLIGLRKNGGSPLGNSVGVMISGGGTEGNRLGDFLSSGVGQGAPGRNIISGNSDAQVLIAEPGVRTQVACNYIGANADGDGVIAGHTLLLEVLGPLSTIGTVSCPNLFAGGRVQIGRGGSQPITVTGVEFAHNYVGVNPAGDDMGVVQELVQVINGNDLSIRDNTIGNGLVGISITSLVSGSQVIRNHVGTDTQGRELPLISAGIFSNGTGISIGTTHPGNGNIVGHSEIGLVLGSDSQLNSVLGNFIGTNSDGDELGNQRGMLINGSDHEIGASGFGNIVAFSTGSGSSDSARGIELHDDSSDILVRHNRIGVGPDGQITGLTDNGDWIGHGIFVAGQDNLIEHNFIGHMDTAIHVNDGSGHVFQFNRIGTGDEGENYPNSRYGIRLQTGGTRVLDNVIGNSRRGIRVNSGAFNTVIGNNHIGVTPDGHDIGNNLYGIYTTANTTRIGVDLGGAALPNTIGFNNQGVRAGGPNGRVQNNRIGMLADSTLAPNSGSGLVILDQASNLDVGDTTGRRNYIAANGGHGIEIRVGGSIRIWLNWIGGLPNGTGAGNAGDGIHIGEGVSNVVISGMGTNFFTGLVVRDNDGRGIALDPDAGVNNSIRRVIALNNQGKAIDLGPGGRDQDAGDFDTGPNNLQNFPEFDPEVSGYNPDTGQIDMRVRLDSDPAGPTSYPVTVDVYHIPDPSHPQPNWYMGAFEIPEARAQSFFDVSLDPLPAGTLTEDSWFVVTATDAAGNGNTSELSEVFGGTLAIYSVGGVIANLTGEGLVLSNNAQEDLVISDSGGLAFQFSQLLLDGDPYYVTVTNQPAGQHCTVVNGKGLIDGQSVDDVAVTCCDLGDSIFSSRFEDDDGNPAPFCPIGGLQQISAGEMHTCAISEESELWCWGRNPNGELGIGETETEFLPPSPVIDESGEPFTGVVQVSAGYFHTCAIKEDGSAWCWGSQLDGRLGIGPFGTQNVYHPERVLHGDELEPLENVAQISTGLRITCARQVDGSAWCWGRQTDGILGNGESEFGAVNRAVRVLREDTGEPLGGVIDINAGQTGGCAVTGDGAVWCWGTNEHGMVGDGTSTVRTRAVRVIESGSEEFIDDAESVAVYRHACAVRSGGSVWCWGEGESGELGNGQEINRDMAVQATDHYTEQPIVGAVDLDIGIEALSGSHSCIVDVEGQAWCWGSGQTGKLGVGILNQDFPRARRVQRMDNQQDLQLVKQIAAGRSHTCALTVGHVLMCWGNNSWGQIPLEQPGGGSRLRAIYGLSQPW